MSVSVIIPVYNQAGLLREALASVLAQTLPPEEIIVMDDGSTDGSAEAAADFGPAVTVLRGPHQGPAAARNRAAKTARGEWLAFLDADDLWRPEKLEKQLAAAHADPPAGLIHTDGWVVEDELKEDAPIHFAGKKPPQGPTALADFLRVPLLTPSVMIRRHCFEREGGFNESFQVNEDADLFLRLIAGDTGVAYVPEPLVLVRQFPGRAVRDRWLYLEESRRLLAEALERFPRHRRELRSALGRTLKLTALYFLAEGDTVSARRYFLNSLRYLPVGVSELYQAGLLLFAGRRGEQRVRSSWERILSELK